MQHNLSLVGRPQAIAGHGPPGVAKLAPLLFYQDTALLNIPANS